MVGLLQQTPLTLFLPTLDKAVRRQIGKCSFVRHPPDPHEMAQLGSWPASILCVCVVLLCIATSAANGIAQETAFETDLLRPLLKQREREHPRVHALVVADTESGLLGVGQDREMICHILEGLGSDGLRPDDFRETGVLQGKKVSRDAILRSIESRSIGSSDTFFLYFSGHGATDKHLGHFLVLHDGTRIYRSELREAMMQRNPRLPVIITDCCSNDIEECAREMLPDVNRPLVRQLLFQQEGTVDINSSSYDASAGKGESAWGDPNGGLFTKELRLAAAATAERLDTNQDGAVDWNEFFARLQHRTQTSYQSFRERTLENPRTTIWDRQALRRQSQQTPHGELSINVRPNANLGIDLRLKSSLGGDFWIAIRYKIGPSWITEGWWKLDQGDEIPLRRVSPGDFYVYVGIPDVACYFWEGNASIDRKLHVFELGDPKGFWFENRPELRDDDQVRARARGRTYGTFIKLNVSTASGTVTLRPEE